MAGEFVHCHYAGCGVAAKREGAWVGYIPSQADDTLVHSGFMDRDSPILHGSEAYAIHLLSILMKRFLKTILLLLSILFLLNVVLDIGFTHFLNRSQTSLYKGWNSIIHDSIDADLLVIGSSRAHVQYDPHIMDSLLSVNSYNLGMGGSHVKRQIVKYEVYRHYQRKTPSFLIVSFDYWGCWLDYKPNREQFFPYLTNFYMRKLIKKQEEFSIGELYVPMYRYYNQGIKTLLGSQKKDYYYVKHWYKGYYWGNKPEWDGEKLAKIKTSRFKLKLDVVDEFDVFLSKLQKDGIKVIFVSSPIYMGLTERTKKLSEFYVFRKYFSEKYDIPVLDYIYDTLCYDTAYFFNATHLNKTGAELFTTKLCHDLDSLGILQN